MTKAGLHYNTEMREAESGFTLIELSIVLVIIGLIVGGILTGQDLIKAAEQRATIAQIEKYNTAVNTFRNKFSGIPGDLTAASAVSFGLVGGTAGTAGTTGLGDGNGLVQDPNSANTPVGEPLLFWYQLSQASLMDGSYGSDITLTTGQAATITIANEFPAAKLGRGNYITVGSDSGINYYGMTGLTTVTGGAAGTAAYTTRAANITPLEAYNMDKKVDDGMPNTGSNQARGSTGDIIAALVSGNAAASSTSSSSTACTVGTNSTTLSDTYNVNTGSGGNSPLCTMRWRFN
ncbi:MAG TPA: prepilin-type N-terminal cleavage/methylation domain-containing protein [Rickettsiales bacterium]|nr:prepilin-type N-terminal cleavage/methylation domain-containing protein [Rickettsiales bacterium]